jgi:hypothetical protein
MFEKAKSRIKHLRLRLFTNTDQAAFVKTGIYGFVFLQQKSRRGTDGIVMSKQPIDTLKKSNEVQNINFL